MRLGVFLFVLFEHLSFSTPVRRCQEPGEQDLCSGRSNEEAQHGGGEPGKCVKDGCMVAEAKATWRKLKQMVLVGIY